jgi:hypothetical protein
MSHVIEQFLKIFLQKLYRVSRAAPLLFGSGLKDIESSARKFHIPEIKAS